MGYGKEKGLLWTHEHKLSFENKRGVAGGPARGGEFSIEKGKVESILYDWENVGEKKKEQRNGENRFF